MIHKYFKTGANTNFSIVMVWINGGSNLDGDGKKGLNKILCSLLGRGCQGFKNLEFAEYIDSRGAELNIETFEDGILISLKSLNEHFFKLLPILDLTITKPLLSKRQFQYAKKNTINLLKKDREDPFNITFEKWRKIVYHKHPYAYNSSGYVEDILKITHDEILSEYEDFKTRNKYLISNNLKINNKNFELDNYSNYLKQINKKNLGSNTLCNLNRYVSTHSKSNQIIIQKQSLN